MDVVGATYSGGARLPMELHIHLEGTVGPSLAAELLASRGGRGATDLETLYAFGDFLGFLEAFRRVIGLLTAPEDFHRVAEAACRRLAAIGVRYAEMIFTPLIHSRRGLDHAMVSGAIVRALRETEARGGPEVNLIYDTVRQWGPEAALESARVAVADRAAGLPVVGFGVGGDELSTPVSELAGAFALAKSAGLKSYIHAGEVGGPESVWEALEILHADRIGHGIAAARDPLLMRNLIERGVTLDVCPTSNLKTGAVHSLAEHPLPILLERGVPVSLGSDDPGFFGAWLDQELATCRDLWGWGDSTVNQLARNALAGAFLTPEQKAALGCRLFPTGN